jgi:hypothetical protein
MINLEFLFRCRFYTLPITLSFKFNCALSVTAKARHVCQNLWTLLLLSAHGWIHLPVSLFVQGKSYSNSPPFAYHRLAISPSLHLAVPNKSLDTGSKDCVHSDNVRNERQKGRGCEEANRKQKVTQICRSGNHTQTDFMRFSKVIQHTHFRHLEL